jgi:ABC-type polysaccharide/polyol phosphate export permease
MFEACRDLIAAAWAAVRVHYRLSRPGSALRTLAAVLDVVVYAGAVYFILSIVFRRAGFDRFELILVGFVAFSWTLRSMLEARNFGELHDRMAEYARAPVAGVTGACLAPPVVTFLASLAVAVVIEVATLGSLDRLAQAAWLSPTIAIQGIWNAVLVLGLAFMLDKRWLSSVTPAVVLMGIVWLLSPVLYRFEDIPPPANPLLTSFNPASHILAAYHNGLWREAPMSLAVLPAAGVIGLVAVAWLARLVARRRRQPVVADRAGPAEVPHLVAVLDGVGLAPACAADRPAARVFAGWRGRLTGYTGEDLVTLLIKVRGGRTGQHADRIDRIGEASGIGRLYADWLSIYPPWALAQLAFAAAIEGPERRIVLDGILDDVRPTFLAEAWARLEREAAQGREITVLSYTALSLPWSAKGTFEALGRGGQRRAGMIGPELDAAYDALRGADPARPGLRKALSHRA